MSTCPDKTLYSAYVDGEVPSPWKEMLEEHLASCEKCRAVERRYTGIQNALGQAESDAPLAEMNFLESSFGRLSARWELAAEKAAEQRRAARLRQDRRSVTISYFALAAMLAVAALVPSFFVARAMEGRVPDQASWQAAQDSSEGMIAPALPPAGRPSHMASAEQAERDFSLINQAKMFAQDKEIFSFPAEGYIIIKLPEMVRFSTGMELHQAGREFFPSFGVPAGGAEAGHIINAMQQRLR